MRGGIVPFHFYLKIYSVFFYRILVISGHHLPRFTDEEDTEKVAIGAIKTVTGINVEKKSIANVHRQGKSKKIIFVE